MSFVRPLFPCRRRPYILLNMRHTKWGLLRRGETSKQGEERKSPVQIRWDAPVGGPDHNDAMTRAVDDVDKDIV